VAQLHSTATHSASPSGKKNYVASASLIMSIIFSPTKQLRSSITSSARSSSSQLPSSHRGSLKHNGSISSPHIHVGWGSVNSAEFAVNETEMLEMIHVLTNDYIDAASVKKVLFKLSKILVDSQLCQLFITHSGHTGLMNILNKLKGNSLTYALAALRSMISHEANIPIIENHYIAKQSIFNILYENLVNDNNTNTTSVSIAKQCLGLITDIAMQSSNGYEFIHTIINQSITIANNSSNKNSCVDIYGILSLSFDSVHSIDIHLAALKCVNALFYTCKNNNHYSFIKQQLDNLNNNGSILQLIQSVCKVNINNKEFAEELTIFENLFYTEGSYLHIKQTQAQIIQQLKIQLKHIQSLALEYRNQLQHSNKQLAAYIRREPLVQLLWSEISQTKTALNCAVQEGFYYDLDDPKCRFTELDPKQMQQIKDLDVLQFFPTSLDSSFNIIDDEKSIFSSEHGHASKNPNAPHLSENKQFIQSLMANSQPSYDYSSNLSPEHGPNAAGNSSEAGTSNHDDNSNNNGSNVFIIPSAPVAPLLSSAPQPTKPLITPLKKMKPLHWQRLLIPTANGAPESIKRAQPQSIWHEIALIPTEVYEEELVQQFHDEKVAKTQEASAELPLITAKKLRLLGDKRFNALSIMLNSMPPAESIGRAIVELDLAVLSKEKLAILRKLMPQEEEYALLAKNSSVATEELDYPEQFIRLLGQIPACSARVDCWHFLVNFDELIAEIELPLLSIQRAIRATMASSALKMFLSALLRVGNYLNGGNKLRGQADGYCLAVLTRLKALKARTNEGHSLASYLLALCSAQDEKFAQNLAQELNCVELAVEFPLKAAQLGCTRFIGVIQQIIQLSALVAATNTNNLADSFHVAAKTLQQRAEVVIPQLAALNRAVSAEFLTLCVYLEPTMDPGKTRNSEEIFSEISEFSREIKGIATKISAEKEEKERKIRITENQRALQQLQAQKSVATAVFTVVSRSTASPSLSCGLSSPGTISQGVAALVQGNSSALARLSMAVHAVRQNSNNSS
jgi:hypothetical protein